MFGIEIPNKNFWLSTLQAASTVLSQRPRIGMHCSTVSKNCGAVSENVPWLEVMLKIYHSYSPCANCSTQNYNWKFDAAVLIENAPV